MTPSQRDVYKTLESLGITLPPVATPSAAYVPYVQTGKLIFVSGNIARKDGQAWVGQLGKNISLEKSLLVRRPLKPKNATRIVLGTS